MGEFSLTHLLIFGFIALLFFGPSRIEGLGKSLGRSIRGFKEGMNELDAEAKPVKESDSQKQIHSNEASGQAQDSTTAARKETHQS